MFVRQRRTVVAACAAAVGIALGAPAGAQALTSGDAYANQDANACSWTMGTAGIEKVVAFAGGEFEMTSLKNKVASPTQELVQGATASDEFRFEWDGSTLRGSSGGWSCGAGAARTVTVGGETAIQLDVTVTRTGVDVTKHYTVFPSTSLIREQVTYRNTSASARTLARPSFLHQRMLGADAAAGDVDLTFMTGASAGHANHGSWIARSAPLSSTYRRDFDSYDQLACGSDALTQRCAAQVAYKETSATYVPWFDFHNSRRDDGVSFGLDLHGRWKAAVGSVDGAPGGLSVTLPNYDGALAPGESVDSPRAWTLTYAGDHDEMTNRLLAWQYRYLWDYTRDPYFAGVRMLGFWRAGGSGYYGTGGGYDPTGLLQKVFGLADHMRHVGADGYHRDYGWWDQIGTWNGPDWRQSGDYLAKSGIRQTLYQPTYNSQRDAAAYNVNPAWWQQGVPCSENDVFGFRLIDLSLAPAADWLQRTLVGNAEKWGDHAWRNDVCPIGNVNGAIQLKQSEALVRASLGFLDARPDSSIQSVNSGGTEFGWELIRRSSSASFTDDRGDTALYDASRLFPVDKISGMPDLWLADSCSPAFNFTLAFTPDYTGTTSDPAKLECLREVVERYRYLKAAGVAGRWIRYYHPSGTGVQRAWLQRVSRDGTKSVLLLGRDQTGSVTVYPKGLNPGDSYSVSFQLASGTATRTGADLMSRGVTLTSPPTGELIWLGLPKRPGAGGDRTAPSAPASVTAQYETNMSVPGVGLTWPASSDDHFLSGYDVLRDGARIAVVSKGTYYFDHSPAASTQSTYAVRAFDADGNRSAMVSTTPTATDAVVLDGAAAALRYSGSWSHQTGRVEAYAGTLSVSSTAGDSVSHVFDGSGVTWYAKLGPANGKAAVTIDGRERTVVDLFAPDETNWRIPVFSRTWNSTARHRVEITLLSERNTRSTGTAVNVDGLRVRTTRPTVTEDDAFTYGGTGWKRPSAQAEASNQSVTSTASSVSQQYDFTVCRTACGGFSGTQGGSDWRYQDLRGGVWTDIATYTARDPTYGRIWHDTSPSIGGWVFPQAIHPGESIDTARTWTAPSSGTIDIASRPAKDVAGGDGVVVKITKNGTTIAGPRTIAATDKVGADMDLSGVTVAAGDQIRFEINRGTTYNSDRTNWDPEILYRRPAGGCALACQLFSAQQGAGDWRYQGEAGGSWSDLPQYGSATADGPGWNDGGGIGPRVVTRTALRPGAVGGAARTWTAPRAGVVDLTGVPAKLETSGDGVVVKVTKNGTTIAGPRTIAAGDTTGSAFGATGVTVAQGDLIRFEIAANGTWAGDLTRWDPTVRYQGAGCQLACQLFSDVQGHGNWRYQDQRNGSWTDIASFLPSGFPTGPTWHDATPTVGGWVFAGVQHPGQSLDTARTWIAPVSGTVEIASRPFKFDTNPAGDGVVVRVTRNGRTVLGPRTIAATDGTGSAFDLSGLDVAAGDAIRFEINRNGTYSSDQTSWDPQIDYTATGTAPAPSYDPLSTSTPSGPLTAEATVTGRTIELIGRRCDACGVIDVYVDGVFSDRVDTFGFRGPNTWQALLWKRSWATSAARRVSVVVTGAKSQEARAAAVFLDSIQATG